MTMAAVCTSLSGTDNLELRDFELEAIGKVVIEMPA